MVLRISNAGVRTAIQNYTLSQTFPDLIIFIQDINGNWVTSLETIQDVKYNLTANKANVVDLLTQFGEQIEYVPASIQELDLQTQLKK